MELLDCGDRSCQFARDTSGQRTNGGCRCLKSIDPDLRSKISYTFHRLQSDHEALKMSLNGIARNEDRRRAEHAAALLQVSELKAHSERVGTVNQVRWDDYVKATNRADTAERLSGALRELLEHEVRGCWPCGADCVTGGVGYCTGCDDRYKAVYTIMMSQDKTFGKCLICVGSHCLLQNCHCDEVRNKEAGHRCCHFPSICMVQTGCMGGVCGKLLPCRDHKPLHEQCWCAAKVEAKDAVCPLHG